MKRATRTKPEPKYRRILLKLSGEAMGGEGGTGINPECIHELARQVREVRALGVQIVVVIGGGNIFRGLQGSARGIEHRIVDTIASAIDIAGLKKQLSRVQCH